MGECPGSHHQRASWHPSARGHRARGSDTRMLGAFHTLWARTSPHRAPACPGFRNASKHLKPLYQQIQSSLLCSNRLALEQGLESDALGPSAQAKKERESDYSFPTDLAAQIFVFNEKQANKFTNKTLVQRSHSGQLQQFAELQTDRAISAWTSPSLHQPPLCRGGQL